MIDFDREVQVSIARVVEAARQAERTKRAQIDAEEEVALRREELEALVKRGPKLAPSA